MKKDVTTKQIKKEESGIVNEDAPKINQLGPFLIGMFVLVGIIILSIYVIPRFIGAWTIILFGVIFPVVLFFIFWFFWVPSLVFGIFIPEGSCVIITRGQENGQFVKIMPRWKDHIIDKDFNIIKKDPDKEDLTSFWNKSHLGINFYFWPFDRVYTYSLEWKQFTHDEKIVKKKGNLRFVLLKPYIYYIEIDNAEDKDKVPQKMGIVAEMMVVNPYKATFMIQNWYRAVSNLIIGDLRDFIRSKSYEELVNSQKSLGEMIWDERIKNGISKQIEKDYGIRIIKITVVEIGPADEEYSRATLRSIIAQKNQDAIIIETKSEVIQRSATSMGLVWSTFALSTGQDEKTVKELYYNNPEVFEKKYGKRFAECLDLVQREIALAKGRFIDVRTDAAGIKGGDSLLALIAANSMMNNQSSGGTFSGKKDNSKKEIKTLKEAGFDIDDDEDE